MRILQSFLGVALCLTPLASQGEVAPKPDAVRWWTDLPKAEQLAAKTGKPLLLVFR